MRIAYLLPRVFSMAPVEGSHSQQKQIVENLIKDGHQITVFAFQNLETVVKSNDLTDWEIVPLPVTTKKVFNKLAGGIWKIQKRLGIPYLHFFTNLRLYELIREVAQDYDLVFERVGLYRVGSALAATHISNPYILFFDADIFFELEYAGTPMSGLPKWVASKMQNSSLHKAKAVICVSQASKEHTVKNWGVESERVYVLPNAVDVNAFYPLPPDKKCEIRNSLNLRENQFVLMFVGSFQPWHDWQSLLKAFVMVRGECADAVLVFVGDGPDRILAEQMASDYGVASDVIFVGAVPHRLINEYVNGADAVVAPYPADDVEFWGSPMKLFEYMASGQAIVAADVGQLADVLKDEETALLYPAGDEDALRDAILRLIHAPQLRDKIAGQAREEAVTHYSWVNYVNQLNGIFESVTQSVL